MSDNSSPLGEPALAPQPATNDWHRYGEALVRAGKLGARDLERALVAQREMGGALDGVLVSLGLVSEVDAARALAQRLSIFWPQHTQQGLCLPGVYAK